MRSILTSHVKVTKTTQNILRSFNDHHMRPQIDLIMSEPHYVKLLFL